MHVLNRRRTQDESKFPRQTDARAERPTSKAYNPQNVFATLYHFLGIDPDQSTYRHPSGRPLHLLDDTNQITELA